MATFSKHLPDVLLKDSQVDVLEIVLKQTAAKTVAQYSGMSAPLIAVFDTGDSSQTAVDSLLGSSNGVTYATTFGSTAMGSNTVGLIIKHGLAKNAIRAEVRNLQTAGGTPADAEVEIAGSALVTTAPSDANTSVFAVTSAGHIVFRYVGNSNLDAATAGTLKIKLFYK